MDQAQSRNNQLNQKLKESENYLQEAKNALDETKASLQEAQHSRTRMQQSFIDMQKELKAHVETANESLKLEQDTTLALRKELAIKEEELSSA